MLRHCVIFEIKELISEHPPELTWYTAYDSKFRAKKQRVVKYNRKILLDTFFVFLGNLTHAPPQMVFEHE